ncbi:hypothetical protein, partial [Acidisphaera rubrifaciens]|uniref:hypothetical protein n=1 Tax=Acidisphaera rubrifaciens TaxID=50715 RepID=UPI0006626311
DTASPKNGTATETAAREITSTDTASPDIASGGEVHARSAPPAQPDPQIHKSETVKTSTTAKKPALPEPDATQEADTAPPAAQAAADPAPATTD